VSYSAASVSPADASPLHGGDWTDEEKTRLRELWSGPSSSGAIALLMHRSKNAVVGMVHRLGLPGRPSPIKGHRTTPAQRLPHSKPPVLTLPVLPSMVPVVPATVVAQRERQTPTPEPPPKPTVFKPRACGLCCWPVGEPGTRGFHFCEAGTLPGKPYCAEHARLAYVKVWPFAQEVSWDDVAREARRVGIVARSPQHAIAQLNEQRRARGEPALHVDPVAATHWIAAASPAVQGGLPA
jgi:GcrA cell cycle regulator